MAYAIAKCPKCSFKFIVEVKDIEQLKEKRVKCKRCDSTFKLIYKNKPSWKGNLAIYRLFLDLKTAQEYLSRMQK